MISFEQKTSPEIAQEVAARVRARRKELKLTQEQLACKAGMTLASYKRFEQKGLIAFQSLVAIGIALDCESDFDELFAKRAYSSIEEVIALAEKHKS
jgi:transcriptional regulator with XRE-family HTH domain